MRRRNALVQRHAAQHGAHGCALGSMANEVSDHNDRARGTPARRSSGGSSCSPTACATDAGFRRYCGFFTG